MLLILDIYIPKQTIAVLVGNPIQIAHLQIRGCDYEIELTFIDDCLKSIDELEYFLLSKCDGSKANEHYDSR